MEAGGPPGARRVPGSSLVLVAILTLAAVGSALIAGGDEDREQAPVLESPTPAASPDDAASPTLQRSPSSAEPTVPSFPTGTEPPAVDTTRTG